MSREFTLHLSPRDPKDEDRLIKALIRQANHGDNIKLSFGSPEGPGAIPDRASNQARSSSTPMRPNDEVASHLVDGLNRSLEKQNAALDQAAVNQPDKTPEARAKEIADTARSVKSWRQTVNEVGWKVFIEAVLKEAWALREQIWDEFRVSAREVLGKIID